MDFVKLQGLGNDYVFVDGLARPFDCDDPPALARRISDRHFGVGADGLIAILPGDRAPFRMRMWNADGSESEMCGNGIRSFAKYVFDRGYIQEEEFEIETLGGVMRPKVFVEEGRVRRVRVDMGAPALERGSLPMKGPFGERFVEQPLEVGDRVVSATCVSMGNPHCVLFVPSADRAEVATLGSAIEHSAHFPRRVNVGFAEVLARGELRLRVWERGSGETLACGTGTCAAVVAGVLTGRLDHEVLVHLNGGDLEIEWRDHVFMTGPTVEVFRGTFDPR